MRKDVATFLTSIALVAGFGIVLTSALSSRPAATAKVVELPPIELDNPADGVLGVDGDRFLVRTTETDLVLNASARDSLPIAFRSRLWFGDLAWDGQNLNRVQDTELVTYFEPDWSRAVVLTTAARPSTIESFARSDTVSFASKIRSLATTGKVSYVGLESSQVYRVAGKDLLEKRLGGGRVTALACVSNQVVAAAQDPDDEKKAILYHLGGDGLDVLASEPCGAVRQLIGVGENKFLVVDAGGLWIGWTFLDKMGVDLEIAGDVQISRNSHDGYVVVSTGSATKLMRLDKRKLATVKNLARGGILDAAFNDNLLAVIYEATPRQVTLYRIE